MPVRDTTSPQDAYGIVSEKGSMGRQKEDICQTESNGRELLSVVLKKRN